MSTPPAKFEPQVLTEEPIGILPAMTPNRLQGYGAGLSTALNQTFAECFPAIKTIPSNESVSQLTRLGVEKELARLGEDWKTYVINNRAGLETVGSALGVRYLLLPAMAEFEHTMRSRFVFLGIRTFQTRIETLRFSLQLWDLTAGEILWESFGEGTVWKDVMGQTPGSLRTIAVILWRSMIEDLLEGKTKSYHANVEAFYNEPCVKAPE